VDAAELVHADLAAGAHMITSRGVDTDDPRTRPYRPQLTHGGGLPSASTPSTCSWT
jgi:hypothetical protein